MKLEYSKKFYKALYQVLGFVFLGLAIIGIVLPVLPTTPFLLLSAWFFARSSDKWHARLLNNKTFGPMLSNWEAHHCIAMRTKVVALLSMSAAGSVSIIWVIDDAFLKLATLFLMLVGAGVVLSIKTCATQPTELPSESGQKQNLSSAQTRINP